MGERILNIAIGDTHFGKRSDQYSSVIGAERLRNFPLQIPLISDIDTVRIHLLGDIVDGSEIYPTHAAMGGDPTPTQVADAVEALKGVVDHFVDDRGKAVEVYAVRGNHGRASRTADPQNNLDLMVYWGLAQHVERMSERGQAVFLHAAQGEFLTVPNGPLLIHRGPPHVGTPARQRLFLSWCNFFNAGIVLSGHWHTPSCSAHNGLWNIINGSLPGPDDFSMPRGWFSSPCQCWFVTREDGSLESIGFVNL